jgi:hypothetical protein
MNNSNQLVLHELDIQFFPVALRLVMPWFANAIASPTQAVPSDICIGTAHPNAHSPKVVSFMQKNPEDKQGTAPCWHMFKGTLPLELTTIMLLTVAEAERLA